MLVTEIVETRLTDGSESRNLLISEKSVRKIQVKKADEENILISLDDGSEQTSRSFTLVLATEEDDGSIQRKNVGSGQLRFRREVKNWWTPRRILILIQVLIFFISLTMLFNILLFSKSSKSSGKGCIVDCECVEKLRDKKQFLKYYLSWLLQIVQDSPKDQLGIEMVYKSGAAVSPNNLSSIDFVVFSNGKNGSGTVFFKI
uniref:Uncharacterized protein n=1 Tax=Graphocephala atropunctata TaxID=36148 RepID=A0A1B6LNE9_9HEMI